MTADAILEVILPIVTVSEANLREHWSVSHRRHKKQRADAHLLMKQHRRPDPPMTVMLTRISPRRLDEGDNLSMSMKSVRDGIADWLGINDGDPRVAWRYNQHRGMARMRSVKVTIFPR